MKDKLESFCKQNLIEIYSNDFDQAAALNVLFPPSGKYSYDRTSGGIKVVAGKWDYINLCPFEITVFKLQEQGWVDSSSGGVYLSPVDLEVFTNMPVGSFQVTLSRSLGSGDDAYGRNYSPDMLDRDDFAETVVKDAQALIDLAKSQIEFFSDRPEGAGVNYHEPNYMKFGRVLQVKLGWYWVYGKPEGDRVVASKKQNPRGRDDH